MRCVLTPTLLMVRLWMRVGRCAFVLGGVWARGKTARRWAYTHLAFHEDASLPPLVPSSAQDDGEGSGAGSGGELQPPRHALQLARTSPAGVLVGAAGFGLGGLVA